MKLRTLQAYEVGDSSPVSEKARITESCTEENDACTYTACIPDISCNKDFVQALAQRCTRGQLSPKHLLDLVLDALA